MTTGHRHGHPTRDLAWHILSYAEAAIDAKAVRVAKHCILDWFAVTLAGYDEPVARILREEIVPQSRGGASIVGAASRCSPADAALINGTTSHGLDYDDVHITMLGHPTVSILPAVLALAETEGASGEAALRAFIAGYETAVVIGGLVMGYGIPALVKAYGRTIWLVRYSLLTIVLMLALGTLTRYSGLDTTLGLAFAASGVFYPFFGTLMGWLGVALTGSDTASNVLFGGMQKVASEQLGLSPNLMGAANSSGGVMGKMIDAQSIVVASTATRWFNHEGDILRYVFFHSIALASLVGILVTLQAYVSPFSAMVVH